MLTFALSDCKENTSSAGIRLNHKIKHSCASLAELLWILQLTCTVLRTWHGDCKVVASTCVFAVGVRVDLYGQVLIRKGPADIHTRCA